jgi:integrase
VEGVITKEFIGDRKTGFVFRNAAGRPLAPSNVLRRSLHPALESPHVPKAGFHSFRRFRATHLSKSRVPGSLVKFWMGHSESNQTEEYVKLFDEVDYRREMADSIGIGFEIRPEKPIVHNVRRKSVKVEVEVTA